MLVVKSFNPSELELSASEIAEKIRIPKPTAYRLLATLAYCGFVEQNPTTGKYRTGPELYILGSLYLSTTDIPKAAEPVVKTLNDLTHETVNVGIFDKGHVIMVMKEDSTYAFRFSRHVGTLLPAHASGMGKAFLSELTEAELDSLYPEEKLLPRTLKTIATKTELKRDLQEIRKTCVSFNREGGHEGIESIGSTIRNASGRVVAAMSISVPIVRMNQGTRERLATLVRLGSNLVSYRLGYRDNANTVRNIQEIRSWWEQNQISDSRANSLTGRYQFA